MISVIVPVYNSQDNLYICLNSILNQTLSDFEIICINDASTDSSKEVLEYFTSKDSRIKIFNNEKKKGEDYCKNKCLEVAQGKYVTFLKCDEWIPSSTLETLFEHAEDNNLDLIFYNNDNLDINEFEVFNPFDVNGEQIEILDKEWNKFYLKSILNAEEFLKIFASAKRISLIKKFFKKSLVSNDNNSINELLVKQHLKQVNNKINNLESSIQKLQVQSKEFFNSQKSFNKQIKKSSKLFMDNYNESKKYFFNNRENQLKEYFDTDELFRLGYFNNFKFISYSPAENRILIKTDDGITVGSNNRFYTIKEVIGFNGYSIPQLYDFDEFVVFDVGMNRAYASLWFANFDNCKSVYGFEIDPETYNKALSNINLNPHISSKIKPYNFGWSDENGEVDLYYVDGCDGVNTMISEVVNLQSELRDTDKRKTKKVQVKKASEILSKIIEEDNITSNIVLKMDTEGAEYQIFEDLIETDLFSKIDVIMGEGHIFKRKHFCDKLEELGFRQIEMEIKPVTYNFIFVKEKYFDVWPLKE